MLTSEAPGAIAWLDERGVEFTRENGCYRLARCGGATRRRLLQVGDRTGLAITTALREAFDAGTATGLPNHALAGLDERPSGWRATLRRKDGVEAAVEAGTVVLAAGGRCYREAKERGELSTNHPGATGEVTEIARAAGAEARDLDALQYHPNGGSWPANLQGYSIPETTRAYGAVLLNAEREEFTDSLGPRSPRRSATRSRPAAASRPRTAGPPSTSTRRASPRRTRSCPSRTCSAATARRESTR